MALGNDIIVNSQIQGGQIGDVVRPAGLGCQLLPLMSAGLLAAVDNATRITNPTTQIIRSGIRPLKVGHGTILRVSMGYDDGASSITDPQLQFFGRAGDSERWRRLKNADEQTTITLVTDTTEDVADGTLKYTDADINAHAIDLDGCVEIVYGVVVALAVTGDATNAVLQGWII